MSKDKSHETNDVGSELDMVVSQTDYQLSKHALKDIKSQKASMNRIMATFMLGGGRSQWAAVVALFDETAETIGCSAELIGTIYIYQDKSATAIVNEIEGFEPGGQVQ
jgi:hypothetical protein